MQAQKYTTNAAGCSTVCAMQATIIEEINFFWSLYQLV